MASHAYTAIGNDKDCRPAQVLLALPGMSVGDCGANAWAWPCDYVADHRKGQRLTLGGCEAPSRGEGRALSGLSTGWAKTTHAYVYLFATCAYQMQF